MPTTLSKDAGDREQASVPERLPSLPERLASGQVPSLLSNVRQHLSDVIYQELLATYAATVDGLLAGALGAANTLTTEVTQQLRDLAQQLAGSRLDRYTERLRAFLETQPDAGELARWLADRALGDAGTWACGDSLEMRRRARQDFYATNPPPAGQWTIQPETAKEPGCQHIAGKIFESYDEAEEALDSAWHPNCVHYVDQVDRETSLHASNFREWLSDLIRPQAPTPLLEEAARGLQAIEDTIRTLPYEVGVAFNSAGQEVVRRTGTVGRVTFTRAELEAMHGGTLTHNHPAPVGYQDGGSFSLTDVLLAIQENLAELRVVSTSYRYILRPENHSWPSRARVRASFEPAQAEVINELRAAIRNGTLTPQEAASEREHRIWERIAVELGLRYMREANVQ